MSHKGALEGVAFIQRVPFVCQVDLLFIKELRICLEIIIIPLEVFGKNLGLVLVEIDKGIIGYLLVLIFPL